MCEFEYQDATHLVWEHCVCAWFLWPFSQLFSSFSQRCNHVTISTEWCSQSEQRKAAERHRENNYYEALAFSWHNNLVFDEENTKPEKLTDAPGNAGIDPSTMRVKKFTRNQFEKMMTLAFLSLPAEWATFFLERSWRHTKDESLSKMMKKSLRWREVKCSHHCLSELPMRELEKTEQYMNFIRTRTRCTALLLMRSLHKHVLFIVDLSFRNLWETTNVELLYVPTYKWSILFNNIGSYNRKSEFRKPDNLNKAITKGENYNVADLSILRESMGNNCAHVILTAEADKCANRRKSVALRTMAWWDVTQAEAMTCQSLLGLIPQGMSVSYGNQVKKTTEIHMQRSLKWNLVRR